MSCLLYRILLESTIQKSKTLIHSLEFLGGDVQRFHTEAEAAAGLDHPEIIFETGQHHGRNRLVMTRDLDHTKALGIPS